jgi:hypothetical protein
MSQEELPNSKTEFENNTFVSEPAFLNFFFNDCDPIEESSEKTFIDLTGKNNKAIIEFENSYFHFFPDFIGSVSAFLKRCIVHEVKDVELLIFIHDPQNTENQKPFFEYSLPFFEHCLSNFKEGINVSYRTYYFTYDGSEKQAKIKIDNYAKIDKLDIGSSLEYISDNAKNFSKTTDSTVPNRKVFISRKRNLLVDEAETRRIHQDSVEELFKTAGFEIINGEMFQSLELQIKYFNDVSVFVGFTGSGLASSMFMQPGQKVVEIVCPINVDKSQKYEIHNFYKTISLLKKHSYVAVSNIDRDKESLIEQLKKIMEMF